MRNPGLTFDDLKDGIRELGDRYRQCGADDLFVLWFLRAYVTDRDELAAEAITGASRDKGIDALLIDDAAQSIFIVQGKYREKLGGKAEKRADVLAFGELASILHGWDDEPFQEFVSDVDEAVVERLRKARKKVQKEHYLTWLYFVTTASVSPTVRKDVEHQVRNASSVGQARIEVFDGKRTMRVFRDWLLTGAQPIPTLELEMEAGSGVKVNGVAQRFDHRTKIESWVFSMRGDAVAAIYEQTGRRLFARNIRGFLGLKTSVNKDMATTLREEPERFFYYNNGITIVCDEAERKSSHGKDILQVGNPQIINGQQTTRTLGAYPQSAARASVLVKVIRVPREIDQDVDAFEGLVSEIVAGTNWQNAINHSDLRANDRRQIELERELRKVGYLYLRKRESKGEAQAAVGHGQFFLVSKERFAQAVAGCDLDPLIIRSGLENLFAEEYYEQVFPNADPDYYLPRYALMREVTYAAKGHPLRGYAKWLVMNFMWSRLAPMIRKRRMNRAFVRLWENQANSLVSPLYRAINLIYVQALRYYKKNHGEGDSALDISQFFRNRKEHHLRFREFWDVTDAASRTKFSKWLANVQEAAESFEE
jgi:hypothetical protein